MKTKTIVLAACLVFLVSASALAAVPPQITFMGRLVHSGSPVTSSVGMTFELFVAAAGGSNVWSDAQVVTPNSDGVYVAKLGSGGNPIPIDNDTLWLQVTVGATLLSPRREITSVPFALRADLSDDVGTLPNLDVSGDATIDGAVGIGTASSGAKVHVSKPIIGKDYSVAESHIYARGSDNGYGLAMGVLNSPAGGFLQTMLNDQPSPGGSSIPLFLNPGGGDVGIGTVSPTLGKLQVDGGASVVKLAVKTTNPGSDAAVLRLENSAGAFNDVMEMGHGAGKTVFRDGNGDDVLTLNMTNGYVGVGTTSPMGILDVAGGIFNTPNTSGLSANVVWISSGGGKYELQRSVSSRRYKKNIKDLTVESEDILKLRPVTYEPLEGDRKHIGLIAEEVSRHVPELVHFENGQEESVYFDRLPVLLLQLIKELKEENKQIQERLDILEDL